MIYAVLATGPSMSQAVVDSIRGRCKAIAVSDSYRLAPWADALVSADAAWWRHHEPEFAGRKFSLGKYPDVETIPGTMGSNSGLLAIQVAVMLGATKVLLLGIDLHGTHFFGLHQGRLRNATPQRMQTFHRQFAGYKPRGVEIINCNPLSHLKAYPIGNLDDHLESMVEPALHAV